MSDGGETTQGATDKSIDAINENINEMAGQPEVTEAPKQEKKPNPIVQRAGEFYNKIKQPDITTGTFIESTDEQDRKIVAELEEITPELTRNKEKTKEVLGEMDADALLMRQVIESRRGIRGIINRLDEKVSIKGHRLSGVVGSMAVGIALDHLLVSIKVANPIAGGITGGALGGFWGYIRGRNKQESVNRWKTDVDIIGREDRESIEEMSPAELEIAIGVINNAVHERKVRGSKEDLMALMRTYRIMKEVAFDRVEITAAKYPFDPNSQGNIETAKTAVESAGRSGLDEVATKLALEAAVGKAITAGAKEKYQALYKEITEGKKKQIWASALKGAVIGATVGTTLSWLMSKILAGASGGHEQAVSGHEQALHGQEQAARDLHGAKMDIYNRPEAYGHDVTNQKEIVEMFKHLDKLKETPGGNLAGFSDTALTHFKDLLQNNISLHDLVRDAGVNNIDLSASVGNSGQTLGNFITANKEAFLHLSLDAQREMLSFPALADQILAGATTGASAVTTGIASAVAGGIGLGALGFGMHLGKKGREKVRSSYDTAEKTADSQISAHDQELETESQRREGVLRADEEAKAEKKKTNKATERESKKAEKEAGRQRNIEAAKNELISNDVIFHGIDVHLTKGKLYKVKGFDNNEQLIFYWSDEDIEKAKSGAEVFPTIHLETLLDSNGNLNGDKIDIVHRTGERERRPGGKTEIETIEELQKSIDYIDAQLKVIKIHNKKTGRDENKGKVVIGGNEYFLDPESENKMRNAGLKNGDKCQLKIIDHEDLRREPGRIFNISIELKPKEEPPPTPTPEPTPEPAVEEEKRSYSLTEYVDKHFGEPEDITEDNIDDIIEQVKSGSRVAVQDETENFYLITTITEGRNFELQKFSPKTGELSNNPADQQSVDQDDMVDNYMWYLENK